MATPQVGLVSLRVNGDVLRIKGNVTYGLGGQVREPVNGQTGLIGFQVAQMGAFIEVESLDADDVDLGALQNMQDATITCQLRNGKTVVVSEASVVGRIEVSGEDGGFTVRFEGPNGREIG